MNCSCSSVSKITVSLHVVVVQLLELFVAGAVTLLELLLTPLLLLMLSLLSRTCSD